MEMTREEMNKLRKNFGLPPLPEEFQRATLLYRGNPAGKPIHIRGRNEPLSNFDLDKVSVIDLPQRW